MKYFGSSRKKWLLGGVLLVMAGVLGLCGWGVLKWQTLQARVSVSEPQTFHVENGVTWQDVTKELERDSRVPDAQTMQWYARWNDLSLKSGKYILQPDLTVKELIGRFASGPNEREVSLTIPEGSRISEIAGKTSQKLAFSEQEFMETVKGYNVSEYAFIEGPSLQGYLFPDTYRFFPDASPEEVIDTMLATFEKKAAPLVNSSGSLSSYEALILASIVEKEVFREQDKRRAADVFLNRLEEGMKLESDATIEYITRSGRTRSTYSDLEIKSPFNTYQQNGLPPTPITNPGISSIKAVLNPDDTEYRYFLTTPPPEQRTIFAETSEEHQRNVQRYLE